MCRKNAIQVYENQIIKEPYFRRTTHCTSGNIFLTVNATAQQSKRYNSNGA